MGLAERQNRIASIPYLARVAPPLLPAHLVFAGRDAQRPGGGRVAAVRTNLPGMRSGRRQRMGQRSTDVQTMSPPGPAWLAVEPRLKAYRHRVPLQGRGVCSGADVRQRPPMQLTATNANPRQPTPPCLPTLQLRSSEPASGRWNYPHFARVMNLPRKPWLSLAAPRLPKPNLGHSDPASERRNYNHLARVRNRPSKNHGSFTTAHPPPNFGHSEESRQCPPSERQKPAVTHYSLIRCAKRSVDRLSRHYNFVLATRLGRRIANYCARVT